MGVGWGGEGGQEDAGGGGRGWEGRVTGRSDLLNFTCHQEIFFNTFLITYNKRIHAHYRA